jgi:hypothetical protein
MRFPEFISHVEADCDRNKMVVRAIGMTATEERFRLRKLGVRGLSQPVIAVISSTEQSPLYRTYSVLATTTQNPATIMPRYPLLRLSAQVQPPLRPHDFIGDFDQTLSDRHVSLLLSGEPLESPVCLWYLEGNEGSLVVNGLPTYPRDVAESLNKLY